MNKVWIVTSGAYSSYGINAVFANRADADQYAAVHNSSRSYDRCDVEEWELNETTVEVGQLVQWSWYSFVSHTPERRTEFVGDVPPAGINIEVSEDDGDFSVSATGRVAEEPRVLKAMRDRRAQVLAEREGVV